MDKRTDTKPDVEGLRHTNILLTELGLTELFPCVWVCDIGDGSLAVNPDASVCLCGTHEIGLRTAAIAWNFHNRPGARFDEPNWPALSVPWLMPTIEPPRWLSLCLRLGRLARRLFHPGSPGTD